MAYLTLKDFHPSITSSLNLIIAENVDVSLKLGYYKRFYRQQTLSENIHFLIYSNEDYLVVISSTFID